MAQLSSPAEAGPEAHAPLTILVNNKDVVLSEKKQTGASVKEAAIRQGVNIRPDFNLYRWLSDREKKLVPNDAEIEVHEGERFSAVAPDDNS